MIYSAIKTALLALILPIAAFSQASKSQKLLKECIDAHGGLKKWNTYNGLMYTVETSSGESQQTIQLKDRRTHHKTDKYEMGFDGIATGLLHTNFVLDEKRHNEIAQVSGNLKITFHRAFDWVTDPFMTLDLIESLGIHTILTSGQQKKAAEGIDLLAQLNERASSAIIMPGSGITPGNAHLFKEKGFKAIHLSAVKMNKKLHENPKVGLNSPHMLSDDSVAISHFETIQEVVNAVK